MSNMFECHSDGTFCLWPETGFNDIGASLVNSYDFNTDSHDKGNVNRQEYNDGEFI